MAKIGEGSLAAMGRLGLKELRNAFNPSRESVADSEIGLYGTATQGEIADARGGNGSGSMTLEDLRSAAKEKAQTNTRDADGPDASRGIEM